MRRTKNVYFFGVVVGNVKTDSCFLVSFEVDDEILIAPYSPRVKFASNKNTGEKPRAHFRSVVFLML